MWKLATPLALLMAGFLSSCGTPCMTMANCMPSYVPSTSETAATLIFRLDPGRSPLVINQQLHAGDGPRFGNRRWLGLVSSVGNPFPGQDLARLAPVAIPDGERLFFRLVTRSGDQELGTRGWYQCEQTFSFIPEPNRTYDLQHLYADRRCAVELTDIGTGRSPKSLVILPPESDAGR